VKLFEQGGLIRDHAVAHTARSILPKHFASLPLPSSATSPNVAPQPVSADDVAITMAAYIAILQCTYDFVYSHLYVVVFVYGFILIIVFI
jgi:hypothetical protein